MAPSTAPSIKRLSVYTGVLVFIVEMMHQPLIAGALTSDSVTVAVNKESVGFGYFWQRLAAKVSGVGVTLINSDWLSDCNSGRWSDRNNALNVNDYQYCTKNKSGERQFEAIVDVGDPYPGHLVLKIFRNKEGSRLDIEANCTTDGYVITVSNGNPSMTFIYNSSEDDWSSTYSCQRVNTTMPSTAVTTAPTITVIPPTTKPSSTPIITSTTTTSSTSFNLTSSISQATKTVEPELPDISSTSSAKGNSSNVTSAVDVGRQQSMRSAIVPAVAACISILVIIVVVAAIVIFRRRRGKKKTNSTSVNATSLTKPFETTLRKVKEETNEAFSLENQPTTQEPDNTSELSYELMHTSKLKTPSNTVNRSADLYSEVVKQRRSSDGRPENERGVVDLYAQVDKTSKSGNRPDEPVEVPQLEMVENEIYGT